MSEETKIERTIAGIDITLNAGYSYLAARSFMRSGDESVTLYIVCLNPEISRGPIMVQSIDGVGLGDAALFVVEFNQEVVGTVGRCWE